MDKQIDISTLLKNNDKIVISGVGGRFPESDTVDEFAQNLYNKVDMIVDDDRRWPTGQLIKFLLN
jgi:acyl transferase domain-containing protein